MINLKLNEIHIRDPFVLTHEDNYYLYGTPGQYAWTGCEGFWCYKSRDLKNWSEPIKCFTPPENFWSDDNFWAPEVHKFNDKFFMFASFYSKDKKRNRATQILIADKPEGPYSVWSKPITPKGWMCLDGTLYVENNTPYMVFCHEWTQIGVGDICGIELTHDLSESVGEPFLLFSADEADWITPVNSQIINGKPAFVTDGPFLVNDKNQLTIFWSSFSNNNYVVATATSKSGKLKGPWIQNKELLFYKDGGHGMLFKTFDNKLLFSLHQPNNSPFERPKFFEISKIDNKYVLK